MVEKLDEVPKVLFPELSEQLELIYRALEGKREAQRELILLGLKLAAAFDYIASLKRKIEEIEGESRKEAK